MEMKKHVLYVGLLDKDTKTQLVETTQAKDLIYSVVGDCTISEATGYFQHDDGTNIKEPSLRVELLFKQESEVFDACHTIKRMMNQESIGVSCETVNCMLV